MAVKIFHTSDWHLGKKLFKKDRIEEQQAFLHWLLKKLIDEKVDILLIAGDIFDVPTPPNSALNLYYDFLEKVSKQTSTHVVIISGNHDSAQFIQAPAKILKRLNIHTYTEFPQGNLDNIFSFEKDGKTIEIKSIPYFRSYDLNQNFDSNHNELGKEDYLQLLKQRSDSWYKEESYKIILSHHAYGSFISSDSEHVLSLAGLETISTDVFSKKVNYVALGHIHKPQKISKERAIHYSGSPIPLRFSETNQKQLLMIQLEEKEEISSVPIPDFRQMRKIKSKEADLLNELEKDLKELKELPLKAWYEVQVKLESPSPELLEKVKKLFSKYEAELIAFYPLYTKEKTQSEKDNLLEMNIYQMFETYYKLKYPESDEVPNAIATAFKELVEETQHEN